jgi:hypothetical protein
MTIRLLTTEEVADRFRTSPSTIRYWRHIGIGPAGVRVGRHVLLRRGRVRPLLGKQGGEQRPVIHRCRLPA